jgi:hypothetical protein
MSYETRVVVTPDISAGYEVRMSDGQKEVWVKPAKLDGDGEFILKVAEFNEAIKYLIEHEDEE